MGCFLHNKELKTLKIQKFLLSFQNISFNIHNYNILHKVMANMFFILARYGDIYHAIVGFFFTIHSAILYSILF